MAKSVKVFKKDLAVPRIPKKVKKKAVKAISRLLLNKLSEEQIHKLDIHIKDDVK